MRAVWFGILGATVYRRLLVLERRLDTPAPDVGASHTLRVILLDDEQRYHELRPDQPRGELAQRRASGALCFAAVENERVLGATWARSGGGPCAYLDLDVQVAPDEIYLFDTFVLPSQRGRRVAPAIAAAQIDYFRTHGARRIISTVLPENAASLRARARSGYVVCGWTGWIRLGSRRWTLGRGLRRREGTRG